MLVEQAFSVINTEVCPKNIKFVNQWIPLQELETFPFFNSNKVAVENRFFIWFLWILLVESTKR